MTMRFAFLTLALMGAAGLAHAQSMGTPAAPAPSEQEQMHHMQAMAPGDCQRSVAITDEYGFRYDGKGERLNAQGCVIAPPHTLPGAGVKN